jgi:putative transposase
LLVRTLLQLRVPPNNKSTHGTLDSGAVTTRGALRGSTNEFLFATDRVVRELERIAAVRGYPLKLRTDNGPEFIALALADWAEQHGVTLEFIKPGKPMQNGFIERFNRSYREAVLDMFVFQTLNEVREQTETWLKEYNEERPHDSLGDMTPREFLLTQNPEVSTYDWS